MSGWVGGLNGMVSGWVRGWLIEGGGGRAWVGDGGNHLVGCMKDNVNGFVKRCMVNWWRGKGMDEWFGG